MSRWFRADDGTFYRNCQCVDADRRNLERKRFALRRKERLRELDAEWRQIFHEGVKRKPHLDPGDIEIRPLPMRIAYPQYPILWTLDGS